MDPSSSLLCLRMELYTTLAQTALAYFNSNQGTKFEFVKLGNTAVKSSPHSLIHLNFTATDDGGGGGGGELAITQMFYAEILRSWVEEDTSEDESEDEKEEDSVVFVRRMRARMRRRRPVEVKGCALLEKVDTGNPLGRRCKVCDNMSVIHPDPRSGYRVLAGDKFESSSFMEYNSFKVIQSLNRESPQSIQPLWRKSKIKHTADNLPMFNTCANLALQHFNHAQRSEFRMVKVLVGFSGTTFEERIVHVNFLAEWPEKLKKPRLFFAEAVASIVVREIPWVWDPSLVKSIKVEGCCRFSYKKGFGSVFGRVCEMCVNDVIHPGPRDGYTIVAGDLFQGYKFMETGNGIY